MGGFLREMKRKDKYGQQYSYWVAVKSYRDKKSGQVKHQVLQTFGRLSPKEAETLKELWELKKLGKKVLVTSWEKIVIGASYEYLSIEVLDRIFKVWGLEEVFSDGKENLVDWIDMVEILVLNRALCPNSDYQVKWWYPTTILPQILNVSPSLVNPTRIYRCLDKVYLKEEEIQKHLYKKITMLNYDVVGLIFYDITSSYFEGYKCKLAKFGLSRDKRKDKPQLLLCLCVTKEGFPFYWRVLPGGVHDSETVVETVEILKNKFNVGKVCVVMDKGMVTKDNLKGLTDKQLYYLVTLPRSTFRNLYSFPKVLLEEIASKLEKENEKDQPDYQSVMKQFSYFTYYSPRAYFHLLEEKEKTFRYILCFNPEKFVEERNQRAKKMKEIEQYFKAWNEKLLRSHITRKKTYIEKEIYSYLKKRKAVHLFIWEVKRLRKIKKNKSIITLYQLLWKPNTKKILRLQLTDGLYCLKSNLPQEVSPEFLVSSYRQRRKVENAFHYLKGFVEIRPFYHHKEERVKAHISICILAYLLQITVEYLLKKAGHHISFQEFISKLVTSRAVEVEIKNLKEKEIRTPNITKEIEKLVQAVNPELFTQTEIEKRNSAL